MGYGTELTLEELVRRDGTVRRVLSDDGPNRLPLDEAPRDMRVHYTLATTYPAGHEWRIDANEPVRVQAPATFTKYAVLIRTAHIAFIAFDREVGQEPGHYDELHPGSARLEDRIAGARTMSIVFPVVPTDPVEVIFYAGDAARPT